VPTPGKAGTLLTWQGKRPSETPDWLAVDEPLERRLGGEPFTFTLGTPGDDFPLVTGLLFCEGVIQRAGVSGARSTP
jgi:formate dehydrogenase assembly factor FdhD